MGLQRTLVGLVAAVAASAASGQWVPAERPDFRLHVQASGGEPSPMDRLLGRGSSQGLKVGVVGKSGFATDLGVYGRVAPSSYGVGFSWDFAPSASAMVGFDSYDLRTASGGRDVRGASLGLHWRY